MPRLDLVPIYLSDRRTLLQRLSTSLGNLLQLPLRLQQPWFDPEISFDQSRGQYNSNALLRLLLGRPGDSTDHILGVTSVDLFVPVLTYVFGEAQLDGRAAIVSIHRLRTEAYGLPRDEQLLTRRLVKESVHELGHTFGLKHCPDPDCVMHASTYVEEIDLKTETFCTPCLEHVRTTSGTPSTKR